MATGITPILPGGRGMVFERVTTEGLSHHSYFLGEGGEAVVVDPRRDVDVYLELARQHHAKIRWVLETHRHEDFAIGSRELQERTGARILHGKALPFAYGEAAEDGQDIAVGRLRIRAFETPGHTAESMTYGVIDTASGSDAVIAFTGDALFVGEVGRTDLYGPDRREELAGWLYDAIVKRILPMGDGVILAPAHGGGSVCGAGILDRNESTLGFERLHNPKLVGMDRDRFIREKATERLIVPPYFRRMEAYNLQGPPILGHLPMPDPLSPEAFAERAKEALIVDTRMPQAFAGGHVPGSYSIWLQGLPLYAGWVLPPDRPILLVTDPETSIERIVRMLVRVGYEQVIGYLRGGFEAWQNSGRPVERTGVVTAPEVREMLGKGAVLLDVRNAEEWTEGVIDGSLLLDTAELERRLAEVPRGKPIISMCSVGHRGSIGASILQRHGIPEVYNFLGGLKAWRRHGYPVEQGPRGQAISRISMLADASALGSEVNP
jgi:hydroxyacylglutathione hydrolase